MVEDIKVTSEEFLADFDNYLDQVKPGVRVNIDGRAVLIHPKDLEYLEKCSTVCDSLPCDVDDIIE